MKTSKQIRWAFLAAALQFGSAGVTNAAIDFEHATAQTGISTGAIASDGYTFTVAPGGDQGVADIAFSQGLVSSGFFGSDFPGSGFLSKYLVYDIGGSNINSETFSAVSGGAFNVTSLELGGWYASDTIVGSKSISLTGKNLAGGTVASTVVTVAPGILATYALTGFTNLRSFELGGYTGGTGYIAVDNILVTAVPEPETIAMLLAGLGVLGFVARRRRA